MLASWKEASGRMMNIMAFFDRNTVNRGRQRSVPIVGGSCLRCLVLAVWCLSACVGGPPQAPPSGPPDAASHLRTIRFAIQVGAFSTPERASRYARKLNSQGLDAYYFIDRDGLCKVRFGSFDSKAAARRHAASLVARGLIDVFYIVRPAPGKGATRETMQASLVATAGRFVGTPYKWGGASVRSGFDCSGLTMTVYRLNGLDLPRTAASQFRVGTPVRRMSLQRGDLVFFETGRRGRISHVGIYSGEGRFIHAPGRGKRIGSASLASTYFASRFAGARRYF